MLFTGNARSQFTATAVLLALAWWCLDTPYTGIRHDALYYAGDALRRLPGSGVGQDLFFHRHSQGDFSVFGAVYAQLIQALGLDAAALALTVAGLLLWLYGLLALCRSLPRQVPAGWLLALGLCLPRFYGPLDALMTAEPFATPRPWAEALVMLALAQGLRGRPVVAMLFWCLAAAMHPLMSLIGAPLLLALLPSPVRWRVLLVGLVLLGIGWWAGVEPLPRLTQHYDDTWWQIVVAMNPLVLWQNWAPHQAAHAMLALLLLADAGWAARQQPLLRRLAWGALVTTAVLLGVWALATETRNVLLIQLQVWRGLWLTHLLAPLLWMAARCNARQMPRWEGLALMACAWWAPMVSAPVLGLAALALLRWPTAWQQHPARVRAVRLGLAGVVAMIGLPSLMDAVLLPGVHLASMGPVEHTLVLASEPLVGAALAVVLLHLAARRWGTAWLAPLLGSACLAGSMLAWGWAAPAKDPAADIAAARALNGLVRPDEEVWSDRGPQFTWLRLQRASFGSWEQRAGALFAREPAVEVVRRIHVLAALDLEQLMGGTPPAIEAAAAQARRQPKHLRIRQLCAESDLDWALLDGRHPEADVIRPVGPAGHVVSIYRCHGTSATDGAPA